MPVKNEYGKSIKLPHPAYNLLRAIAAAEDRTLRSVMERALAKYAPRALKKTEAA